MVGSPFGDVRMRGFAQRISVARFREIIRERTPSLAPETVPLAEAANRVLAAPIEADHDVPPFDRSAMDGYALRGEETFGATAYNPLQFKVVGEVTPGRTLGRPLAPGEAARIMTGAPLPEGSDAVLMAEYTEEAQGVMTAREAVPPGRHIGRTGEDIKKGTAILPAGRRLRPQDLGVIASTGRSEVVVHRRPEVALLITGNELLEPGKPLQGAMIYDSNSVMLQALIARDGGHIGPVLRLRDDRETIRAALREVSADLVVTTGGTSVGVEDHTPTLIEEEGELLVHGVAMRPSAPTGLGWMQERAVFLLPGNPVSCLAAYDFFVSLALGRLGGAGEIWPYPTAEFPLRGKISSQIGRVDYARVRIEDGEALLVATSGASILSSTTLADGFVVVPQDSEGMPDGAVVRVWLYDPAATQPAFDATNQREA